MNKNICILCLCLTSAICCTSAQDKTSNFDVRHLIHCYYSVCDRGTFATKKSYFEAFPSTFVDFKNVFGYQENPTGETYGELYKESLSYIVEFFYLNECIPLSDFSDKVIHMCIDGKWQADGVNYLKANVVNIVTSTKMANDCYYYLDIFPCYNDMVREVFLSRLILLSDDDVLSFWKFYLDGAEVNPIDDILYQQTLESIQQFPKLIDLLGEAYNRAE